MPKPLIEALIWIALATMSGALCWSASVPSTAAPGPEPPPPLSRPVTDQERAQLEELASQLSAELILAADHLGRALEVHELEGSDPHGRPWLSAGLPDNPTMPGHAHVIESCEEASAGAGADWLYCQEPVGVRPVLP